MVVCEPKLLPPAACVRPLMRIASRCSSSSRCQHRRCVPERKTEQRTRSLTDCAPRCSIVFVAVLNGCNPVSSQANISFGFRSYSARKPDTICTNLPICAAAFSGANWAPLVLARCVNSWLQIGDSDESHHAHLPIQETRQPSLACRKRRWTPKLRIDCCRFANNCRPTDGVADSAFVLHPLGHRFVNMAHFVCVVCGRLFRITSLRICSNNHFSMQNSSEIQPSDITVMLEYFFIHPFTVLRSMLNCFAVACTDGGRREK